ncbi:MAG: hypothetical protein ABIH82_01425 [Candidatus Woesearchaeota archaeon]
MRNKDEQHNEMRNYVEELMKRGSTAQDIADVLEIELGSGRIKYSVKWYISCVRAKQNQKKAIEKYPDLYSRAGKIAQQKHPWLGYELGKKYGAIEGKKRIQRLKEKGQLSEYMSSIAKILQEINPNHSRLNMKKAHEKMKKEGTFHKHQREAALKCRKKNPNQLKEMSKIAHKKYPLALLALESRRKNYPYNFMNCSFDSNEERKLCEVFINESLIKKPIEGKNVHLRIGRCHVDFFLGNKVFVEYHPPIKYGGSNETAESYYNSRRNILDNNGYKKYPLVVISSFKEVENKITEIKKLLTLKLN